MALFSYNKTHTTGHKTAAPFSAPPIKVWLGDAEASPPALVFTHAFRIGRDESCQVRLQDFLVSRFHAEIVFENGQWWLKDLNSRNGTYRSGVKVERAVIDGRMELKLGLDGPAVSLEPEVTAAQPLPRTSDPSVTQYIRRYFEDKITEGMGQHTIMMRQAFQHIKKRHSRRYVAAIAAISVLLLCVGVFAWYKHRQLVKQQTLARDIFYEMKDLELMLASFERVVVSSRDEHLRAEMAKYRTKREELKQNYDHFVDELGIYKKNMSEDERLIFRIARIWGECEVDMPEGFVQEVRSYIRRWQSTDRLKKAVRRAEENGFAPRIAAAMLAQHMPPQFFYLALQESDFNVKRCGPMTKYGIAKGMWQFIPSTAVSYGLRTGPLVQLSQADPKDDRHDFEKSTQAAARYLRYIYDTDAQASGLLVIASYNWGEHRIIDLLEKMPANPRERNFWKFLESYRTSLPQQTYDYVFYIFSAAVIGEHPRLFGFEFNNPLGFEATGMSTP
ncbi:MAG: FHA domain-containing protein [bacterium]